MSSSNSLDLPLYKAQKKAKPTFGDVGIELEIEGKVVPTDSGQWALKDEGSLRGGGEYVLLKPAIMQNLPPILQDLQKALDSGRPVNSIRCSTHIHVNVTPFTPRQIWQILLAYYLLEPLLVRSQPKKRWANLFCLDMEHAEAIFIDLEDDLGAIGQMPFKSFTRDRNRYAALNLVAIHKFGSIEFRFLDAMTKTADILAWTKIFYNLVQVGADLSPVRLLKTYDEIPASDFVRTLLGAGADKYVLDKLPPGLDINNLIHTNYDYVVELAQDLSSRKFELAQAYWNEDLFDPEEAYRRAAGGLVSVAAEDTFLDTEDVLTPGATISINPAVHQAMWDSILNNPLTGNTPNPWGPGGPLGPVPTPQNTPDPWDGPAQPAPMPQPTLNITDDWADFPDTDSDPIDLDEDDDNL